MRCKSAYRPLNNAVQPTIYECTKTRQWKMADSHDVGLLCEPTRCAADPPAEDSVFASGCTHSPNARCVAHCEHGHGGHQVYECSLNGTWVAADELLRCGDDGTWTTIVCAVGAVLAAVGVSGRLWTRRRRRRRPATHADTMESLLGGPTELPGAKLAELDVPARWAQAGAGRCELRQRRVGLCAHVPLRRLQWPVGGTWRWNSSLRATPDASAMAAYSGGCRRGGWAT